MSRNMLSIVQFSFARSRVSTRQQDVCLHAHAGEVPNTIWGPIDKGFLSEKLFVNGRLPALTLYYVRLPDWGWRCLFLRTTLAYVLLREYAPCFGPRILGMPCLLIATSRQPKVVAHAHLSSRVRDEQRSGRTGHLMPVAPRQEAHCSRSRRRNRPSRASLARGSV